MHHLQYIVQLAPLLKKQGLKHIVLCPGSRNAPLMHLFTTDGDFECHSIVDERSAAYVALGMCRELNEPVAVVTTSGTAVLNLHPAVAEARARHLPLLIISADRPAERISQFDNQRANHDELFWEYDFRQLHVEDIVEENEMLSILDDTRLLLQSLHEFPSGPVQINILLREPLYVDLPPLLPLPPLEKGRDEPEDKAKWLGAFESRIREFARGSDRERMMILVGMGSYTSAQEEVLVKLASMEQVVVVAENLSRLQHNDFISYPELVLSGQDTLSEALLPDQVLALGGQVLSKRLRLFLEQLPDSKLLDSSIHPDPAYLLQMLAEHYAKEEADRPFSSLWKKAQKERLENSSALLEKLEYSNVSVVHEVLNKLPKGAVLHLGNSSVVRIAQLMKGSEDHCCYSNRGTSGIDGCLSTAVGAAMVSDKLHVLILGDLSLAYDSNGFWNRKFPDNLRIVVLNDHGGGIFRLLDGPSKMPFYEDYSIAHHPVDLCALAESYGHRALKVENLGELRQQVPAFLERNDAAVLLEADTSACENSLIFKSLLK